MQEGITSWEKAVGKVIKCSPEVAERLSRRLLKKGLVVAVVKEVSSNSPWINRADVVLVVKDADTRKH
jgi:hypothetical protein